MTKALVHGIDPRPLKAHLVTYESGELSLALMERFITAIGGEVADMAILRELQAFRSKGGIAHLAGSKRDAAAADLGIAELSNASAFESIAARLTAFLERFTALVSTLGAPDGSGTP